MLTRDDGRLQTFTVGIDVGSTTTQLAVCESLAEMDGTKFRIVARRVKYQSNVILTPYASRTEISGEDLAGFFAGELREAQIAPSELDGGAVILTGTALEKQNSRVIGEMLGDLSSRFLSVGAGDALETVLSAHGSGALSASGDDGRSYLLCDIGGGTTKLALCVGGEVHGISAIDVGARLVAWDSERRIIRVEPAAERVSQQLGFIPRLGDVLPPEREHAMAERMADIVLGAMGIRAQAAEDKEFVRVNELPSDFEFDAVVFAGGVAEFIHEREANDFGDLGRSLGAHLRSSASGKMCDLGTSIRSTVLGISQASFELSGNTIFVHPPEVLPVRNMPVIAPRYDFSTSDIDAKPVESQTRLAIDADGRDLSQGIAISLPWGGSATVDRLTGLGTGVLEGVKGRIPDDAPVVLLCHDDVAALIGRFMKEVLGATRPLVSVDGVSPSRFDFVDVSEFLGTSGAATVHIKSLVFPDGTSA